MSLSTWDDDDQQTSDALQSSIYSHNTELTTTTPAGQGKSSGYEPNQFQRAQSSLNNNLITHNNDFSDMRALEAGSSSTGLQMTGIGMKPLHINMILKVIARGIYKKALLSGWVFFLHFVVLYYFWFLSH